MPYDCQHAKLFVCLLTHVCSKRYLGQNFWVTRVWTRMKLTSIRDLASTAMKVSGWQAEKAGNENQPVRSLDIFVSDCQRI